MRKKLLAFVIIVALLGLAVGFFMFNNPSNQNNQTIDNYHYQTGTECITSAGGVSAGINEPC